MEKVYNSPSIQTTFSKSLIIPILTVQLGLGLLQFVVNISNFSLSAYGGAHSDMSGYSARRAKVLAILGLMITVISIWHIILFGRSRLTMLTYFAGNAIISGLSALSAILTISKETKKGWDISNDFFSVIIFTGFFCFSLICSLVYLVFERRNAKAERAGTVARPRSELMVGGKGLDV